MRTTFALDVARVLALMALGPACGRLPLAPREPDAGAGGPGASVDAGDAAVPTQDAGPPRDAPGESQVPIDGNCPDGLTACGRGDAIRCYDLGRTSDHCGACGHACAPGIACQAGTCQQHRCAGALTFKALASTPTTGRMYGPALGDFDGDGILDLAGTPDATGAMSLLYGAGDGTFPARQVIDAAPVGWQALAGDIDRDGWLDLASMSSSDPNLDARFTLTVRRGSGDRRAPFGQPTTYPTGENFSRVLLADFDADGRLDLVAGVRDGFEYRRGQEGGQFAAPTVVAAQDDLASFVGIPVSSAVAADWNGDQRLDLVYTAGPSSGPSLHFRLGRGDGTFDAEVPCALAMGVIGDIDNDGRSDVLSNPYLLLGLATCNPKKVVTVSDWPEGARGALADLDGDGNLDVVIDGPVSVRLGDGKGGFSKTISLPGVGTATPPRGAFLFGDVNRDAKLDIVYTRPDGWSVFINTCP
jgi:hypothetical protein